MGKIACPCGETMHDDTSVVGRFVPEQSVPKEVTEEVHRQAVECFQGTRLPYRLSSHILDYLNNEASTRVHRCQFCGRICWDIPIDKEKEKYELIWFKPESLVPETC
jgi:hypothetical protein